MLLESLAPLLEALGTIKFDKKSDENFSRPLEADIPSLGKLRKLSGIALHSDPPCLPWVYGIVFFSVKRCLFVYGIL